MRYISVLVLVLLACAVQGQEPDEPDKKDQGPDGLKALKHPDPAVRYKAAALLVRLGPVGKIAVAIAQSILFLTSHKVNLIVSLRVEIVTSILREPLRLPLRLALFNRHLIYESRIATILRVFAATEHFVTNAVNLIWHEQIPLPE